MKIVFVYRAALVVLVALKVAHQLLAAEVLHRDEMLRYGNFVPDFFRRLSAPAITSMHVAEMVDCVISCLQNSLCFSFNFQKFLFPKRRKQLFYSTTPLKTLNF